jgi:hypothetical protein
VFTIKFTFIAPIHYIEINTVLNKGIKINEYLKISNDSNYIERLMNNKELYEDIGYISFHELSKSTYIYAESDLSVFDSKYGEQKKYVDLCFRLLRETQTFLESLWDIKDNNAYVRDGFIHIPGIKGTEYNRTQKASVSQVNSTAEGLIDNTTFTKEEIITTREVFMKYEALMENYRDGGKSPLLNPFTKKLSRLSRSYSFISAARSNSVLPLKIFHYCSALECLFTNDNSEVSHKIAERVAALIGTDYEDKKQLYKNTKKAYGIRSKLTHGQSINQNDTDLVSSTKFLDEVLRKVLREHYEVFNEKNDMELEDYFMRVMFK